MGLDLPCEEVLRVVREQKEDRRRGEQHRDNDDGEHTRLE